MNKDKIQELRDRLKAHYETHLTENLWRLIGINHVTFLNFMYGDRKPILKTMVMVKRYLDALPKENA